MLEVLLKLRELGYPSHLAEVAKNGLKCDNKEADGMVSVSFSMEVEPYTVYTVMSRYTPRGVARIWRPRRHGTN